MMVQIGSTVWKLFRFNVCTPQALTRGAGGNFDGTGVLKWRYFELKSKCETNFELRPHIQRLFWSFEPTVLVSLVPWPIGSSGARDGRFGREPLPLFFCGKPPWAVLAWAGMPTPWPCPSSISSFYHGFAHSSRCLEGWFWTNTYVQSLFWTKFHVQNLFWTDMQNLC